MSRSYKHIGFCKCEKSCKIGKKFANRKVRNYKGEIPNGKAYKKIYNSWDICDYYNIETWNSYKNGGVILDGGKNLEKLPILIIIKIIK